MKLKVLLLTACLFSGLHLFAGKLDISYGGWKITFNRQCKTLTYARNGKTLLKDACMQARGTGYGTLCSKDYPKVKLTKTSVDDKFGTGIKYVYTYYGLADKDNLEQVFYIYPALGYMFIEGVVKAKGNVTRANYIAPIVCSVTNIFLPLSGENMMYDMPHDNDKWVGYAAKPFYKTGTNTSCEVSAFYDVKSRNGLIVGSVEHDNWKSGITATMAGSNELSSLCVAAGVVNGRTNDVQDAGTTVIGHGTISGAKVRSPRYFFGYYADWRNGLEDLGDATAKLSPKLKWDKGTVFAWQSWGGMAEHVNYEGAIDVSDFFYNNLMPNNFKNENGTCYIVLDSFWNNNFTDEQLRDFVEHCKKNGQHAGIYTTPFSFWGTDSAAELRRPYRDCPYTYGDMALRAGGKIRHIEAIALDPTHPATLEMNRRLFDKVKALGFEYIKLDFINSGTLEADRFFAPGITTGMQAYTYGMDKILEMAKGMFVDLSIAPVFPAKGNARRVSCDAWGEIEDSMYSLNSIGLGWWLDRVYDYNDPDHLVLARAGSDGAARIRYTCGIITGTMLLGDNYSLKGSYTGKQEYRDLAMRVATNKGINDVARLGRSFRPVEGGQETWFTRGKKYSYGVDNEFTLDTPDALYYVVFNYDKLMDLPKHADFERLGISTDKVKSVKELWRGTNVNVMNAGFNVYVPKLDVCVYKIEKE